MSVTPGACDQCKATGLPILPVRYTVVPKKISPALPGWAGGDRVKSVDIGSDFNYALRTVRTGFIYLFYDEHARGNKYWECYSVAQDGGLTLQPSTLAAKAYPGTRLLCANHSHVAVGVHYLVIEQPEKCGATWIAFSQDKWSNETVKEYTSNTKLRNARMQTMHPAQMIDGAKHTHGAIASKDALEGVLEYSATVDTHALPHEGDPSGVVGIGNISQESGDYAISQLTQMSTRYPWALREEMADATAAHMQSRAKAVGGKPGAPHVLALWDAIGITHELNGFRNDAAGWFKKYHDEREMQFNAITYYDGIESALEHQAKQQGEDYIMRGASDGPLQETRAYWQDRLDHAYTDEDRRDAQRHLDETDAIIRQVQGGAPQVADAFGKYSMAQTTKAWSRYQGLIDSSAVDTFRKNSDRFHEIAVKFIEQRTPPIIRWMEARLFLDTLNDFHGQAIDDGMLFEEAIGAAMFGIGSSKSGQAKIEEWVKEAKATNETNLLWRAMALNQDDARKELDSALAEAEQHKGKQTVASAFTWIGYTAKSLKAFADTYKKAQGVLNGNANAVKGTSAFGARINAVNMRGMDALAISVGDSVFRYFRIDSLADCVSEKIIQHMFSIRAFVNPDDSLHLIAAQAREDGLKREDTLKRLRRARTFLAADIPDMKTAQSESMRAAWDKFKADTGTPGKAKAVADAGKDARLALVVGLIEGVNFAKLLHDCKEKGDAKSYFSLLASAMSITSAMFDIAAVVSKSLPGVSDAAGKAVSRAATERWGYQGLKMWGGVLSGGATFIGACFDVSDALKNADKGYDFVSRLYIGKAVGGFVSLGLTAAVIYTYAAPLVSRLAGGAVVQTVEVTVAGRVAGAIIGVRLLGMALSGWVTVILTGIQVTIWIVTPNAIEVWIDYSAFGKKRKTGGFRSPGEQDTKLKESLIEMGLQ